MERRILSIFKEEKIAKLDKTSEKVFKAIHSSWPANPLDIAKVLGDKGKDKTLSAKYLYHFKKLAEKELIQLKKTGNTYIAWPIEIEKIRVIQELIR